MDALYLCLTLGILISVIHRRRHRRQKFLSRKRLPNRKKWIRPTITDRITAGAFQSTFLVAKEFDRLTVNRSSGKNCVIIIILFGLNGLSCSFAEANSDPNQASKIKLLRKLLLL